MENHEGLFTLPCGRKEKYKGCSREKEKDIKVFAFFIVCVHLGFIDSFICFYVSKWKRIRWWNREEDEGSLLSECMQRNLCPMFLFYTKFDKKDCFFWNSRKINAFLFMCSSFVLLQHMNDCSLFVFLFFFLFFFIKIIILTNNSEHKEQFSY